LNLLISFTLVWYTYFSSSDARAALDKRLLLSVEYPGETGPMYTDPTSSPQSSLPSKKPSVSPLQSPVSALSEGINFSSNTGVFDKYRLFKSHAFARTGSDWTKLSKRQICLGAQTSVDRLYHLVELIEGWSGPLSLAVFVPDLELAIANQYIQLLVKCFPQIQKQVSFHYGEPLDHPGQLADIFEEVPTEVQCKDHKLYLKRLLEYRSKDMLVWRESYKYPQNFLRNLAKSSCQTNYTYIPDIDMVLPRGMDQQLEDFMQTQDSCDKCAFVVPTYEISDSVKETPQSKTELLAMVKEKQARPFHSKLFSINQKSSNLGKWENIDQQPELEVAYKVDKYIFKYEPLYIARGDTPPFDERFIGFGMTRNTQVYEMYVAGYEFYVLNNVFTNHWGLQNLKSRPSWRAKQQELNNAKFDEFAKELTARYGRDPYDMLAKLPKMNLKHLKVFFGDGAKKPAALEDGVGKPAAKEDGVGKPAAAAKEDGVGKPAAAAKEDGKKASALDEKKPAAIENGVGELANAAKEDWKKPASAL